MSDYIDRDPQRVRVWDYDTLPGWELGPEDSCVVRRASVEPASARVRRLRGLARDVIAAAREGR